LTLAFRRAAARWNALSPSTKAATLSCVRVALLGSMLVLVLAVAAPSAAMIVVQRGIAGLELKMTKAQVRAKLGTPPKVRTGTNDFGRYTEFVYPRVTVLFQSGSRATAFRTFSRAERTPKGVGVGSTERQVKAKVGGVRCSTDSGVRHCYVGRFLPGRVVTDFQIRKSRVTSIVVGFVVD
jgi:hypothetical protein